MPDLDPYESAPLDAELDVSDIFAGPVPKSKGTKRKHVDDDAGESSKKAKASAKKKPAKSVVPTEAASSSNVLSDKTTAEPKKRSGKGKSRGKGTGRSFTSSKAQVALQEKQHAAIERVSKELSDFKAMGVQSDDEKEAARQRGIQAKQETCPNNHK